MILLTELYSIVSISGIERKKEVIMPSSHETTWVVGIDTRSMGPLIRLSKKAISFGALMMGVPERRTIFAFLAWYSLS